MVYTLHITAFWRSGDWFCYIWEKRHILWVRFQVTFVLFISKQYMWLWPILVRSIWGWNAFIPRGWVLPCKSLHTVSWWAISCDLKNSGKPLPCPCPPLLFHCVWWSIKYNLTSGSFLWATIQYTSHCTGCTDLWWTHHICISIAHPSKDKPGASEPCSL